MPCESFPQADVCVVRDLAARAMELAMSDEYEARRKRWRDVNERRKADRAPVWCRPAAAWSEILPPEALQCTHPTCRGVEQAFRMVLYKDWVGDDHIFEPWWSVGAVWDRDTEYTWGLRTGHQDQSTDLGGFHYDPPIKNVEDYERVQIPTFSYNHEATQRAASQMSDLLGDAMPVRLACYPPLNAHFSVYAEQLRGMAPMLEDLAFRPHLVHRLMARLTEGTLRALRVAEESGMLTPNHYGPMVCSDPLGTEMAPPDALSDAPAGDPAPGKVRLHNLWADVNSQEFQNVSPTMHEQFLLNYQIPVLQQFGAVQYGCCEDLSRKVDIVLRIPNLRIFVCSAWTNLDTVIAKCGHSKTIMWRQSAADVVYPDSLEPIRAHLEAGLKKLQGYSYQVVLRELQTLRGRPERLREWARLGIELAEKYA